VSTSEISISVAKFFTSIEKFKYSTLLCIVVEIAHVLEELGLSRQEAEMYIAVLQLGESKASLAAQKAGVTRAGAYYTLKLLKERGLVSEVIKSGVVHYAAVSPARLPELVDEEGERKKALLSDVMSQLGGLQQTALQRPTIEIYEGYEGFKTIFSKLVERPNVLFRCYLSSAVLDYLPHFHEQFRKRRVARNIKIRTLTERTSLLEEIKKLDKKELREIRYLDGLFYDTDILYYILDDAIVIIRANRQHQIAIYIKEEKLAHLHRNIFDLLWKQASR
jgi:sugar-specific transcriptional regulator TrmB